MIRYRAVLAYDGTGYCGWQRQANGVTVQQKVEEGLAALYGRTIPVLAAGRTDSGVHASGQVISWQAGEKIAAGRLPAALNHVLPPDIRCLAAGVTEAGFHPRHWAVGKKYCYRFVCGKVVWPFLARYVATVPGEIDEMAVRSALPFLTGRHNFAAFQASGSPRRTTVRTIHSLTLEREVLFGQQVWRLSVTGDGFLYRMVRNLVGTLLAIGQGKLLPQQVGEILAGRRRAAAGPTAPACGLYLARVYYPGDVYEQ
ncbi:MAG: tRNA pseudouridine(38-40) synthase TruA [Negativicutes bacterium]|nr:tRNA pseudouridine(38-40) synthase TruA [Negativicutes bacterium]